MHHNVNIDDFLKIYDMKKTILICAVMVMTKTTAYTQVDSSWWYDHINNMLQKAFTPIKRAEAYYTDFIYCHGGQSTPYYPYYSLIFFQHIHVNVLFKKRRYKLLISSW